MIFFPKKDLDPHRWLKLINFKLIYLILIALNLKKTLIIDKVAQIFINKIYEYSSFLLFYVHWFF
jgi:hypothetical protein